MFPAILAAYNASIAGITGVGQTIAVVGDAFPARADLTSFRAQAGINQSLANIQSVPVAGGPTPPRSSRPGGDHP